MRKYAIYVLLAAILAMAWWGLAEQETHVPMPKAEELAQSEDKKIDKPESKTVTVSDSGWVDSLHRKHDRIILRSEHPENKGKEIQIRTYGPLEESVKIQLRGDLLAVIRNNLKKLENADSMSPTELMRREETVLVRKAQIELLDRDEYITTDPGDGQKIWPHDTENYIVVKSFKKSHGRTVHIVYLLEFDKFPELKVSQERIRNAQFVECEIAARKFNALPLPVRQAAFAIRFERKKASEVSDSSAEADKLLLESVVGARVKLDKPRASVHVLGPH